MNPARSPRAPREAPGETQGGGSELPAAGPALGSGDSPLDLRPVTPQNAAGPPQTRAENLGLGLRRTRSCPRTPPSVLGAAKRRSPPKRASPWGTVGSLPLLCKALVPRCLAINPPLGGGMPTLPQPAPAAATGRAHRVTGSFRCGETDKRHPFPATMRGRAPVRAPSRDEGRPPIPGCPSERRRSRGGPGNDRRPPRLRFARGRGRGILGTGAELRRRRPEILRDT
jgi:hypothetical protein